MSQKKWNPEEYNDTCILQYNTAFFLLESMLFYGNESILDIGCGSGKITNKLAQLVPNGCVKGLDLNQEMIDFAENTYTDNHLSYSSRPSNISFESQDVTTMSYKNCFDVAVSFWTLSWVSMDKQVQALENIIASLKVGGRLLLMYPTRHDAYNIVDEVIKKPKWAEYFIDYKPPREFISEQDYREKIISNLSIDVDVERRELPCHYKNDQEMIDSINCWLAHVDEIPEKTQKELFLKDVADSYKHYNQKYRGIDTPTMYYSTLVLTGSKS